MSHKNDNESNESYSSYEEVIAVNSFSDDDEHIQSRHDDEHNGMIRLVGVFCWVMIQLLC